MVLLVALAALILTQPALVDSVDVAPPDSLQTAAAVSVPPDSVEQRPAPPPRTAVRRADIEVRPRVAPSALYSSNYGFGIGGGVGIRNLGWDGSDLVVDLRVQQRNLSTTVTLFTNDPYDSSVYGLVSGGGSTTGRRRYYGLGPNTLKEEEVYLYHDAAQAEARLGVYPLGSTALLLQPSARFLFDHSGGVNEDASEGTLAQFSETSREAVEIAQDRDRYGLSLGLEVATDLRDWPSYPTSGSFLTVEARRFFAFDESELQMDRYSATAIGYFPIQGRTTFILRGVGILTRSGDADGDGLSDPIPFYYLPTLDDRVATAFRQDRLTGRDVGAVGAGIRWPVFDFLGVYGIDALAMGFLGNAYDDIFTQFEPRVSFSEQALPGPDGRAPLRPALGLGLGVVNLDKERVVIGGLVGIGPGGITLATLQIAYDLRDARPLFR